MGKFLKFEKMITPIFIQITFWIGFVASIISGFVLFISGITGSSGGAFKMFLGLIILIMGPIAVRIYSEMLIVIFKIQSTLIEIRDQRSDKRAQPEQVNVNQEEAI